MTDNLEEKISALVDGEMPREEIDKLLDGLKHDNTGQMCWRHYHLISDALKNNLPDRLPEDFVNRISLALESEPLLLTPPRRRRTLITPAVLRPAIGFALAASIAAVVFVGLGWNTQTGTGVQQIPNLASNTTTPAPGAAGAIATTVSTQPTISYTDVRGGQWDVKQPELASKLNDYLINHDQYSAADGMHNSVLPQVRIVGFERSEVIQPGGLSGDDR
jgi:sigma-E factor negative regulatory protein RseA